MESSAYIDERIRVQPENPASTIALVESPKRLAILPPEAVPVNNRTALQA